jgi:PIN domain nuclease of toxin-antitoxin system
MKLLLDTHIFLWYASADSRLHPNLRDAIQNPDNEVLLSVASYWESVVKHALGKLSLPEPAATYIPRLREAHGISTLAVEEADISALASLPLLHRDPFDRLLIAQSLRNGATLVSMDREVRNYAVPLLP